MSSSSRTQVGIVGAGPAGLMLSHLLARAGIDSVAVDTRDYETISTTHRAGILEHDSVRLLVDSGACDRVLTEGREHDGISLRFNGEHHRIDFQELVGATTTLYPQTDVFVDLAKARERDGGDVRFAVTDSDITDVRATTDGERPRMRFTDADGERHDIECDVVVGADGSRSVTRQHVEGREELFRSYPYAWFGILCEAPQSYDELIYSRSERGFALISQRTDKVQRMYFGCSPDEDVDAWSDDRIWEELQTRVAGEDGFELQQGPIIEKTVLPFRSFVCEPMRYGRLVLAGDAAHTVPPTGAKGLNLALADVRVLAEELERFFAGKDDALDAYAERALARVWRAQHFSYWMTTMLHTTEEDSDFDDRRHLGELESLVSSENGRAWLAECYTGWPNKPAG
ncbi:4-hydroxybenzoate 3-monooxygenase [Nocardioides mangrovicus]|uniref:4-hydroxybenzoate 3-monooxygenase n=1 Tax=Nocardioides mangrovicus TaxID=2478913 RepID=A0A3L8NYI3_9ACTN|nr:4-hydroxybenzoate 3-monooxygenase [Nocardioides mangrovicus]RLV48225.1 4-hydroxybenzoate 3-monooxygenase [Nocardioides mangrovicus]